MNTEVENLFVLRHSCSCFGTQCMGNSILLFLGPTSASQKDFQNICNELLEHAAMIALDKAEKQVILWSDIVSELPMLLEQHNFILLNKVKEAHIDGLTVCEHQDYHSNANFCLLKKAGPLIIEHNERLESLVELTEM